MKNTVLSSILILNLVFSCNQKKEDNNEIYNDVLLSALLQYDILEADLEKGKFFVLDSSYILHPRHISLIEKHKSQIAQGDRIRVDLIEKLIDRNNQRLPLKISLENFVTDKELQNATDLGMVKLSQVVYEGKCSQALFFYELLCGPECGSGNLVFVNKSNDTWSVEEVYQLYVM